MSTVSSVKIPPVLHCLPQSQDNIRIFQFFFLLCIPVHNPQAPTTSEGFTKDVGKVSTALLPPLPALPSLPYLRLHVCTSQCSRGYVAKNNDMCLTDRVVQGSRKGSAVGRNSCCTQCPGACCLLGAFPLAKPRERQWGWQKPVPAHPLLHPALEIP